MTPRIETMRGVLLATTAWVALTGWAVAGPLEPNLVAGKATVTSRPDGATVTQTSPRAIIGWRDFSVGASETVQFRQPGADSIILNRVTGGIPSRVDGNIKANGQVVLVNPDGVNFGAGARVDVNGLVATTSDVADGDFMAGRLRFTKGSTNPSAKVVNQGTITVDQAGYAVLSGAAVDNSGTVAAKLGTVVLGASKGFTLDLVGDGLLTYQVTAPVDQAPTGTAALVTQTGVVAAPGGTVLLTARAARSVTQSAINLSGIVRATQAWTEGGSIVIDGGVGSGFAGAGSRVSIGGAIDVAGVGASAKGGAVTVTGDQITIEPAASINASGPGGGGVVRIGGDAHGSGPLPVARAVTVAKGARIAADATRSGAGGTVVVFSQDRTDFAGAISAKGGPAGGNGGWVEVSGKRLLGFTGLVDTTAPIGVGGALLLDPSDIIIGTGDSNISGSSPFIGTASTSTLDAGTLVTALTTTNVTVDASSGPGTGSGSITVASPVGYNSNRTLTLNASGSISVAAGITNAGNGGLTLTATGDVTVASGISMGGAGSVAITSANGAIAVLAGVTLSGSGHLTVTATNPAVGVTVPTGANLGTVNTAAIWIAPAGGLHVQGGGMSLNGSIGVGAGTVAGVAVNGVLDSCCGGLIDVTGTASAGAASANYGFALQGTVASIGSTSGAVSLTGTGTGGSTGPNAGIQLLYGASINTGGVVTANGTVDVGYGIDAGTITGGSTTLNGAVTTGGAGSIALRLLASVRASATSGVLALNASGTGSFTGIHLGGAAKATGANGKIQVSTDTLAFVGGASWSTGAAGTVSFSTASAGGSIGLAGGAGSLQISNSQLAQITSANVTIGSTGATGLITVGGGSTIAAFPSVTGGVTLASLTGVSVDHGASLASGASLDLEAPSGWIGVSGPVTAPGGFIANAGTGSSGAATGVFVTAAITTTNSTLSITGVNGGSSPGVSIGSGGDLATGSGGLTLSGSGGVGVSLGHSSLSSTGAILVQGVSGGVSLSGATVSEGTGANAITFETDAFNATGSSLTAPSGRVVIEPYTSGTAVGVSGGAGTLQITSAALGQITTNNFVVGSTAKAGTVTFNGIGGGAPLSLFSAADISVTGAISLITNADLVLSAPNGRVQVSAALTTSGSGQISITAGASGAGAISLAAGVTTGATATLTASNGAIAQSAGSFNASAAAISASGGISLGQTTNNIGTLAVSAGGPVVVTTNAALVVGTVGGVTGVGAGSGATTLASTGDLTLVNDVSITGGSLTLIAGLGQSAGLASGGDVIVSGGALGVPGSAAATIFTGSIIGSTGVAALSGGTGYYRYDSTSTVANYTKALPTTGVSVVYRKQPNLVGSIDTGGVTSRTYDATTNSAVLVVTGAANGEVVGGVTVGVATNAGAYSFSDTSTLATQAAAVGYAYTAPTAVAYTIDAAPVTASLVGVTKPFDGGTTATLAPSNFSLAGFLGSDGATVTQTVGSYASSAVGSGIAVSAGLTVGNFTATGATLLSNYALPTSATGTGAITAVASPPPVSPPPVSPPVVSPPVPSPPIVSPPVVSPPTASPPTISPPIVSNPVVSPPAVSPPPVAAIPVVTSPSVPTESSPVVTEGLTSALSQVASSLAAAPAGVAVIGGLGVGFDVTASVRSTFTPGQSPVGADQSAEQPVSGATLVGPASAAAIEPGGGARGAPAIGPIEPSAVELIPGVLTQEPRRPKIPTPGIAGISDDISILGDASKW